MLQTGVWRPNPGQEKYGVISCFNRDLFEGWSDVEEYLFEASLRDIMHALGVSPVLYIPSGGGVGYHHHLARAPYGNNEQYLVAIRYGESGPETRPAPGGDPAPTGPPPH